MSSLELKVPPGVLVVVFGAAMFIAARLAPELSVQVHARLAWCGALLALGVAIAVAAIVAFRMQKTTVNPVKPGTASAVVRSGVYRFSRNPMYLSLVLILGALAVYLANVLAAALLPAFIAYMNRFQIVPEERALTGKFGHEYAAYAASVRRWV